MVPHLGEYVHCKTHLAKNGSIISPIGVALAIVRDMVEHTINNPTEKDILAIRQEAINRAIANGANPETVECVIEVDISHQKVRAIAMGATELRTKDLTSEKKTDNEIKQIVAENWGVKPEMIRIVADNGSMLGVTCEIKRKKFLVFSMKKNDEKIYIHTSK